MDALLRSHQLDKAVRLFEFNCRLFPKSGNTFDSLAEAYAAQGQSELALENYRKALDLNPRNNHARDQIAQLSNQ